MSGNHIFVQPYVPYQPSSPPPHLTPHWNSSIPFLPPISPFSHSLLHYPSLILPHFPPSSPLPFLLRLIPPPLSLKTLSFLKAFSILNPLPTNTVYQEMDFLRYLLTTKWVYNQAKIKMLYCKMQYNFIAFLCLGFHKS